MRPSGYWGDGKISVAKDKDLRFTAEGGEGAGFSVGALLLFTAGRVSVAVADYAAGAIQGYLGHIGPWRPWR